MTPNIYSEKKEFEVRVYQLEKKSISLTTSSAQNWQMSLSHHFVTYMKHGFCHQGQLVLIRTCNAQGLLIISKFASNRELQFYIKHSSLSNERSPSQPFSKSQIPRAGIPEPHTLILQSFKNPCQHL